MGRRNHRSRLRGPSLPPNGAAPCRVAWAVQYPSSTASVVGMLSDSPTTIGLVWPKPPQCSDASDCAIHAAPFSLRGVIETDSNQDLREGIPAQVLKRFF